MASRGSDNPRGGGFERDVGTGRSNDDAVANGPGRDGRHRSEQQQWTREMTRQRRKVTEMGGVQ